MAIVTPADRPKSIRNRCVIEVFGGVLCVDTLLFGFFCRCKGFCHRAGSDLFLFLWLKNSTQNLSKYMQIWRILMYQLEASTNSPGHVTIYFRISMSEASLPQRTDMWYLTFYQNKELPSHSHQLSLIQNLTHSHFCTKLWSKTKPVYGIPTFPLTAKAL